MLKSFAAAIPQAYINREHKIKRQSLRDAMDAQKMRDDVMLANARLAQEDTNSQRQFDATTRGQDIGRLNNQDSVAANIYGTDKQFETSANDQTLRALIKKADLQAAAEKTNEDRLNAYLDSFTTTEDGKTVQDKAKSGLARRMMYVDAANSARNGGAGFRGLTAEHALMAARDAETALVPQRQYNDSWLKWFKTKPSVADEPMQLMPLSSEAMLDRDSTVQMPIGEMYLGSDQLGLKEAARTKQRMLADKNK